jgi:hypothetical protein
VTSERWRKIQDVLGTEWLTSHHLRKITTSKQSGGRETLFQDPDDGRHREQTYPQSQMQGAGPPALK